MSYKTFLPGPELGPFIKCYWTLDLAAESPSQRQTIVPDGCMEMIFHYGDPYYQYISPTVRIQQPDCFVFGQITSTLEIEPSGDTGIFAARFHPNGFLSFATIPVEEMQNKALPLTEIFGQDAEDFQQSVLSAESSATRMNLVEDFLLKRLKAPDLLSRVAQQSVELLMQSRGQLSVLELSDQLSLNRRNLERKFARVIGLSPKQLARIIRLQAALKLMQEGHFENLTSLAYQSGYFDQAHFIKDFREFTGYSPRKFYAASLRMSSLFVGAE